MGTDGNSQLVAMWDAAVAAITNTFDAYGWIVPAILVALLYLVDPEKADFIQMARRSGSR
jgi:hypothetical protein